jgi:hypothetical protein
MIDGTAGSDSSHSCRLTMITCTPCPGCLGPGPRWQRVLLPSLQLPDGSPGVSLMEGPSTGGWVHGCQRVWLM